MTVVIYALADPRTGAVRYVGQAVNLASRLRVHRCLARKGSQTYACRWIRTLFAAGLSPLAVVLEQTELADEREKFWIALFRARGARLTNATEGGEGRRIGPQAPLSEEHKAKISASLMGIKRPGAKGHAMSAQSRAKLSATKTGVKQKPPSPATRAKISAAHKGRKKAPETVRKVAAGVKKAREEGRYRQARGPDSGRSRRPESYPVGAGWGNAKLTDEIVAEDRRRYKAGGITSVQLARERGVAQGVMYAALTGKTWAHVAEPPIKPRKPRTRDRSLPSA